MLPKLPVKCLKYHSIFPFSSWKGRWIRFIHLFDAQGPPNNFGGKIVDLTNDNVHKPGATATNWGIYPWRFVRIFRCCETPDRSQRAEVRRNNVSDLKLHCSPIIGEILVDEEVFLAKCWWVCSVFLMQGRYLIWVMTQFTWSQWPLCPVLVEKELKK